MAACEPASFYGWLGYISVAAGAAAGGFALTASPFLQTPKKEPKTLAPPWAPRWGSGFPLSGIAPGARRQPAIHGRVAASSASLPSCPLRNACVRPAGKGPEDQDQKPEPEPEPEPRQTARPSGRRIFKPSPTQQFPLVGAGLPAKRAVW